MKKIPTLFKRCPSDMRKLLRDYNDDCAWVAQGEGVAVRKYDGACCKIDKNGSFWKRRELKNVDIRDDSPPYDFVAEQYDPITRTSFGWMLVDRDNPNDRWFVEAYDNFTSRFEPGTYELCGPKVNGNPEKYEKHVLISHADAEIFNDAPRDYDGLREYMSDKDIEGIVFRHKDGRMAKIKKKDFGMKR